MGVALKLTQVNASFDFDLMPNFTGDLTNWIIEGLNVQLMFMSCWLMNNPTIANESLFSNQIFKPIQHVQWKESAHS